MAPLPDNNTQRTFIDYSGPTGEHTVQLRFDSTADFSALVSYTNTIATLVADALWDQMDVTGLRYAGLGQNFSIPLGFTPLPGQVAVSVAEANFPRFVSFVGRSAGGRRVRFYLWGVHFNTPSNYRFPLGVAAELDALHTALSVDTADLCAIDSLPFTLKNYINVGYNSYYERKRRLVA